MKILLIQLFILPFTGVFGQTLREAAQIQPIKLHPPMEGELHISGTFGEPRPNHYHAGLDIKTGGKIGLPVYAVETGFVSRIKVSSGGYGNALYVSHPMGLTTVYAHLDKFEKPIAEFVRKIQYEKQSFEIDTVLNSSLFPVKKAERIALSGNSGGSAGPHLHFEIRETHSELALNPMAFGFKVKDKTPPQVAHLKVYPIQNSIYDSPGSKYKLQFVNGIWDAGTVEVPEGFFALSVEAFDRQDLSPEHKNGIPILKMYQDSVLLFQRIQDSVDFSLTRYCHAIIDYSERIKTSADFYLMTQLPGNAEYRPYQKSPGNGRLSIKAGETKQIRIELQDFHGNTTAVKLLAKGIAPKNNSSELPLKALQAGSKDLVSALISWEKSTFYDHLSLDIQEENISAKGRHSSTYSILTKALPAIHTPMNIELRRFNIDSTLLGKALLVLENAKKSIKPLGTTILSNGSLKASFNEPGSIYLAIDSVAPEIRPLNFNTSNKSFAGKKMQFRISDSLSGVKSYKGFINNQWILFEFDAKNNLLTYYFDEKCPSGEHELKLVVTDQKENIATFTTRFKN